MGHHVVTLIPWRRLSDRTKRVLASAASEAVRAQSNEISPDHVLLGFLECDGAPARVLRALGVDLTKARTALGFVGTEMSSSERHMRPSAETTRLVAHAAEEMPDQESRVEPEHLLLALARDPGSASGLLERLGITGEDIRAKLLKTDKDHETG